MLYAKLDENGDIIDVKTVADNDYHTLVAPDNPVVADILTARLNQTASQELLYSSDQEMMRVLEDLIDLLIEKRLIQFTELPLAAQKKLLSRKWVRNIHTRSSEDLLGDNYQEGDSLI